MTFDHAMPLGSVNDCIGAKSNRAIVDYLREIGDSGTADKLAPPGATGQMLGFSWGDEVWGHTGVMLGFIASDVVGARVQIRNAATIEADAALKDSRLRITLDRFYVHKYPGNGRHKILLEFGGKNQIPGDPEELRFILPLEANDKANAGLIGVPIFIGALVGKNGLSFEGKSVNVSSSQDEGLLAAMQSGPFKQGLSLLTSAQPALKPFIGLTQGIVAALLARRKNKTIHYFKLGLDFAASQTGARLREGSFVVIQSDAPDWSWDDVWWDGHTQRIIRRSDGRSIEFNYLVFRVERFQEETDTASDAHVAPTRSVPPS